jgi:hypothetical protein
MEDGNLVQVMNEQISIGRITEQQPRHVLSGNYGKNKTEDQAR